MPATIATYLHERYGPRAPQRLVDLMVAAVRSGDAGEVARLEQVRLRLEGIARSDHGQTTTVALDL